MRDSNQEKGQRKDEKVDIDWVKKKNKRTKVEIEVEEKETRGKCDNSKKVCDETWLIKRNFMMRVFERNLK